MTPQQPAEHGTVLTPSHQGVDERRLTHRPLRLGPPPIRRGPFRLAQRRVCPVSETWLEDIKTQFVRDRIGETPWDGLGT